MKTRFTGGRAGRALPGHRHGISSIGTSIVALVIVTTIANAQDTVRVKADGRPVWGENVRLVEEFSIGELDGPPEYAFGRLEWIAVEPGGAFYTYDANDRQIRRFDARGRFVRLIGGKGAGPGEYQYVTGMAVARDSLLLVSDPGSQRITYFGADGKVRREVHPKRGSFYDDGFVLDRAGRFYLSVAVAGGPAEGPGSRVQYLRFRDTTLLDSLLTPPRIQTARAGFVLITSDGARYNFINQSIVSPYSWGGMLSATSSTYRIVVDTGGPVVRVLERQARPVALGGPERDEWIAMGEFLARRSSRPPYDIPRTKPFIRALTSDNLGRIWVGVYVVAEKRTNIPPRPPDRGPLVTWRERSTYDVFAPEGQYLGRVVLPVEGVLMAIRDDRLWVRTKGPDDEDRVTVFRIDRR